MPLRNVPIQRKITLVILLTSGAVLLLACASFFAYEFVTFRETMVQQLSIQAEIVAANSTAALAFEDREGAYDVLSALQAEPNIEAAALYDRNGDLFTHFPDRLPRTALPSSPSLPGYRFVGGYLSGFQPVVEGDSRLGTLYLRSGMGAIYERFRLYAVIVAIVVIVALLLAVLLSETLQKQISVPILKLAETARAVSDRRDYSVRAVRSGNDEVGLLTDAFNHMLKQIHEQLDRLDLLNRITHAIGERQDLRSIFQVVVDRLEAHLPIDFGCVCIFDSERQTLEVRAAGKAGSLLLDPLELSHATPILLDPQSLSRCLRGELVYEPDASRINAPFLQLLAQAGLSAVVLAPLLVEDEVLGILVAARREPGSFSSPDCEFLRQLSEHVALASHQARLHEALQKAFDDLRRTQQAAMQQERLRALGQMASGIAHNINNAISPVTLYTESLLENEGDLSPRARSHLEIIQRGIDDVAATVARMRDFYRRGDERLELTPMNLNDLVRQSLDLTRARWSDMPMQQGVVIETETNLDPAVPDVRGVEGEIREALINLIFNAVDAMPEGGRLTLSTRLVESDPRSYIEVVVADTGIGMDEETLRRSREPFFTTKGERGTGLGLAMIYGVMQRHRADMTIESAPAGGTTVRLWFYAGSEAEPPPSRASTGPVRRRRILVVDDDPLILRALRETLEDDGHLLVAASSGEAALDSFRAALRQGEPFHVVITDLGMPHMDGRKVAAAVKASAPETAVLLLTGWGRQLIEDGELPPHVDRILTKPPKLHELRSALYDFSHQPSS